MSHQVIMWVAFAVIVPVVMAIDLGILQRKAHAVALKEALIWSSVWISLALIFGVFIYFELGPDKALSFYTAYLVEESLSVDNLFVFLVIFSYFSVPPSAQHKALFWGIIGALVMRGIFIIAGLTVVERLHWVIYIFGAFLVFTGVRLSLGKGEKVNPENNPILKLARKFLPVTETYHENSFFKRNAGKLFVTPLFLVVLVLETTDIMFAVDSIPAVLSVTLDPFIVYTSNVFAILGLRSIFFALSGVSLRLHYLSYGLSVILVFLGLKMLTSSFIKLPTTASLGIVGGILFIAVIVSLLWPPKHIHPSDTPASAPVSEHEQAGD